MLIQCLLGRIAPVAEVPNAVLVGERNATKWIFEITHEEEDPIAATFSLRLVDWRTGKPIPKGILQPTMLPRNHSAAQATVYFPSCEDGLVGVSIEYTPKANAKFRLAVDAVHSLMR
jgi:hypothetical protein